MRAWSIARYGKISDLELGEHPDPALPDDRILVRVKATAVNPADLKVITNTGGGGFLHAKVFPLIPGFDFSGIVEAVGNQAKGWEPGAEVFGFLPYSGKTKQGSFCELITVRPNRVGPKPEKASHVEMAGVGTVAVTALQSLRDKGGLSEGQKLLVNGASGGVGSYAVQIGRIMGAEVWGTCRAASKEHVESLGAARVVDYRETGLRELGQKYDVILDAASNASYGECSPILAKGGTYVTLLPSASFVTGKIRSLFSSRACRFTAVSPRQSDLEQLAEWIGAGKIITPVAAIHPFAELPQALAALEKGGVRGKIVVEVG